LQRKDAAIHNKIVLPFETKNKMKLYVNQNIPIDNNCYHWWMVALIPNLLEMEMLELHKEQFATRD